jgi:hypothetical protein
MLPWCKCKNSPPTTEHSTGRLSGNGDPACSTRPQAGEDLLFHPKSLTRRQSFATSDVDCCPAECRLNYQPCGDRDHWMWMGYAAGTSSSLAIGKEICDRNERFDIQIRDSVLGFGGEY